MRWTVNGADRQTGETRAVVVEASDRAQAERRGGRAGLLVESAAPLTSPRRPAAVAVELVEAEPPVIEEEELIIPGFDDDDAPPPAAPVAAPVAAPAATRRPSAGPLAYSSGQGIVPSYAMLRFWCGAAIVGSWLAVAAAALFIFIGLLALVGGTFSRGGFGFGLAGFASSFFPAAVILLSAGPLGVLGYGGLALIDIARNSYRR